jgi:hypothetical protein
MGELYEKIFWLNMSRNGGSSSTGKVAQPKTERWLNLAGLSAQKHPEYSTFYAYNTNGNRGIACGLNNLQKLADGTPLGGRSRPEDDFADDDDDDDFLS